MLTKIVIEGPATFKKKAVLETDKKVNLIYGLNGVGKSTLCRYLRNPDSGEFQRCSLESAEQVELLVFNDEFIEENFYASDTIKGIFSLSRQNKDAEARLSELSRRINEINEERNSSTSPYEQDVARFSKEVTALADRMFDIKRSYSGGDRVLEFCLEGLMGSKEKLVEKLVGIDHPEEKPTTTIESIQEEARLLKEGESAQPEPLLSPVSEDVSSYDHDPILSIEIVGGEKSTFAEFINRLKMSDWVRQGLTYLDSQPETTPATCPFCQQPTVDDDVISGLKSYFDRTYEEQIARLHGLQERYEEAADTLVGGFPKPGRFYDERIVGLQDQLKSVLEANRTLIAEKVRSPSISVSLKGTKQLIEELNKLIEGVNKRVRAFNAQLADIESARRELSRKFWLLMRWDYDQTVSAYLRNKQKLSDLQNSHAERLAKLDAETKRVSAEMSEVQKSTLNIDQAISNINSELINIGIVDFMIAKHSDHLYRLERPGQGAGAFKSLSEGEKMIIALLYFCELCSGQSAPNGRVLPKVAVLDDPISSMSHIYVFNVGRLLRTRFFNGTMVSQVFVLTHSLYFFYELTDTNRDRREKAQSLFRVVKNAEGSSIVRMSYEEIQNDYHAYWQIINDRNSHPAIVANCMRNVVEYFFGFVEKRDFNNVFQKPELQKNKFQAFSRYMNRESHSLGQNVFDIKEFDYDSFRDGLRLVFEANGYSDHYKQMAKIGQG